MSNPGRCAVGPGRFGREPGDSLPIHGLAEIEEIDDADDVESSNLGKKTNKSSWSLKKDKHRTLLLSVLILLR